MKSIHYSILKWTQFTCLCWVLILLSSCSISFEKRRYRPGYHVEVVKNHQKNNAETRPQKQVVVDVTPVKHETLRIHAPIEGPNRDSLKTLNGNKTPKVNTANRKQFSTAQFGDKALKKSSRDYHKYKHIKSLKETKVIKNRKTKAWIIGAIAILLAIIAILSGIFAGNVGIFIAALFGGFAVVLAVVALLIRYVGLKKEKANNGVHQPVKPGFINGSFITSIIVLSVSLIGFVLSCLIYPFGLIGWGISIGMLVASLVAMILGFIALKDDKGLKTILSVVFAIVALIIAVIGIALIFL
jgi:hypothetical protein